MSTPWGLHTFSTHARQSDPQIGRDGAIEATSHSKGVHVQMRFFRILGVIVLALLAVGLGGAIFQTGYLAGVAADGTAPVVVGPGYGYGWGWGFGGLFGFLGFLLFLFIFIAIVRAIVGGGRGGWGRGGWGPGGWDSDPSQRFGPWEERAREVHDEWHRREASGGSAPSSGTSPTDPPSGGVG